MIPLFFLTRTDSFLEGRTAGGSGPMTVFWPSRVFAGARRRTPRVRRAAAVGLLALAIGSVAAAQGRALAQIEVRRDGELYSVRASAQLAAEPRVVWGTLTDYERLRDFVPGVTRARVLERDGNRLTIEQSGVFTVLFFDLPVQVRLNVQHLPCTTILASLAPPLERADDSTLRSFKGRYTLTPGGLPQRPAVRLEYDAQFELAAPLPPLIGPLFGVSAVRQTMRQQFEAMLREIERRQVAAAAENPG